MFCSYINKTEWLGLNVPNVCLTCKGHIQRDLLRLGSGRGSEKSPVLLLLGVGGWEGGGGVWWVGISMRNRIFIDAL